jgi:hypothetical protein
MEAKSATSVTATMVDGVIQASWHARVSTATGGGPSTSTAAGSPGGVNYWRGHRIDLTCEGHLSASQKCANDAHQVVAQLAVSALHTGRTAAPVSTGFTATALRSGCRPVPCWRAAPGVQSQALNHWHKHSGSQIFARCA